MKFSIIFLSPNSRRKNRTAATKWSSDFLYSSIQCSFLALWYLTAYPNLQDFRFLYESCLIFEKNNVAVIFLWFCLIINTTGKMKKFGFEPHENYKHRNWTRQQDVLLPSFPSFSAGFILKKRYHISFSFSWKQAFFRLICDSTL